MKKIFVIIVALSATTLSAKDREFSHSLTLSEPDKVAQLDISLMTGKISVEGYKGKTIEIKALIKDLRKVKVKSKKEDPTNSSLTKGLKRVENTSINLEIEEQNNKVDIDSSNRNQYISLIIKVPFNTNLELELHRGEGINIVNVHGSIDVESHEGPLTAIGIHGPIVAEVSRSNLTIDFDKFDLKKPSSLAVHRGDIDLTFPKKSSVGIEVKNYGGDIYSGLTAEFKSMDKVEKNESSKHQQITIGGSMVANLNGGKQKLYINTRRGDIYFREK